MFFKIGRDVAVSVTADLAQPLIPLELKVFPQLQHWPPLHLRRLQTACQLSCALALIQLQGSLDVFHGMPKDPLPQ